MEFMKDIIIKKEVINVKYEEKKMKYSKKILLN